MFGFLKDKLKTAIKSVTNRFEKEAEVVEIKQEKEAIKEAVIKELQPKEDNKLLSLEKELELAKNYAQDGPDEFPKEYMDRCLNNVENIAYNEGRNISKELQEIKKIYKEKESKPKEKKQRDLVKEVAKEKPNIFEKISQAITTKKISESQFDELFWELEVELLENNVAFEVIEKIKNDLKPKLVDVPISRAKVEDTIEDSLRESISELLSFENIDLIKEIKSNKEKPYVIVFLGTNGSGKCVTGETLIPIANGDLISIKDLYEKYKDHEISVNGDYFIMDPNLEVFSLNKSQKIITQKPISICKLRSPKILSKIKLVNGMEITTTNEHPLLSIENGKLIWKKAENIKNMDFIAVPRILPKKQVLDLDSKILSQLSENFFVNVESYNLILNYLTHKFGSLTKAHKELKIKRSYNSFIGFWRYRKILPINLYLQLREQIPIQINSLQFGGSKAIPIPILNPDLSELVGLVLAEGHLKEKVCEMTNKDIKIIERFCDLNLKLFGIKAKVFVDNRGLIRARIYNWSVIRLLHDSFEIPFGNKSRILVIPNLILKSDELNIKSFLRSYIEAEGHIGFENRTIEIATASKNAALGIIDLLLKIGIESTLTKKETSTGIYYRIFISGDSKYQRLRQLGLYTKKNDTLEHNNILPKQFELTNLIPNCGDFIKSLRVKADLYQKDLSKKIGCSQSLISCYETNTPISRNNLLQVSKIFNSSILMKFAESDISWIPVKSVKKINAKDEWVYDLSMENSNFIANNIVSHNTTTIAKVAHYLKKNNLSCILAAADTFRAAAIQQLEVHGKKLSLRVIKQDYGADPAAVCFDAIKHAKSQHIDCVLIDTSGRLHSNKDLMRELDKIIRISKPNLKVLVSESITGNDAVEQAMQFNESIGLDSVILTKSDIDEKGGTIISFSYMTKKPILFLGMGQNYDDLKVPNKKEILKILGF